jgi:plasmid stabilization system protein ParE
MLVRWTTLASDDLSRITRRIRHDNSAAARKVAKTLYRIEADAVEILRIYHSAQDWP